MKHIILGGAILLLALFCASLPAQTVPPAFNYQGRLTDGKGDPLPNGEYTIAFRLWSDPVSASTNEPNHLLWGRERNITVVNGAFNVILDETGAPVTGALVPTLARAFEGPWRYLGLTLIRTHAGTIPASERREILPRQQILSAPYALEAQRASSLAAQLAEALCPVGSIIAWMGTNTVAPEGWAFCWGQEESQTDPKFARLFAAIGTSNGGGAATFNLPDLRGMFLRGVNGARSNTWNSAEPMDPDVNDRTNSASGGTVGNLVGSIQLDAFKRHIHPITIYDQDVGDGFADRSGAFQVGSGRAWTESEGGSETRPKNVYVQYLIKL